MKRSQLGIALAFAALGLAAAVACGGSSNNSSAGSAGGSGGGTAGSAGGGTAGGGGGTAGGAGGGSGGGSAVSDGGANDGGANDGGDSDGGTTQAPGQTLADGGTCTAAASYAGIIVDGGELPYADYTGPDDAGDPANYVYGGPLNNNPEFDYLDIEMYAGYGAFANGLDAGTYTLTGDDLQYSTCGLCVLIYTDYNTNTNTSADSYLATGGTVTITSLSTTAMSGTVSNLTFQHVNIDQSTFTSTPVGDGCDSSIPSASFSAPVEVQPNSRKPPTRSGPRAVLRAQAPQK